MPNGTQVVCFRLGKETYGVDILDLREIVKAREITPVPGTAPFVLGIINLRGKIVSVVDLGERLGLARAEIGRASRVLVLDLDGFAVGFLVDAATDVVKLSPETVEPMPRALDRSDRDDCLQGVVELEGRVVVLLDPAHLFSGSASRPPATSGRVGVRER